MANRIGRRIALGILSTGLVAWSSGTAVAAGASGSAGKPPAHARQGDDAIKAFGDRLPAIAAAHGKSADAFKKQLRSDDSLWLDDGGGLFVVDTDLGAAAAAAAPDDQLTASPSSIPDADTFLLHSNPGASRVVYLDFDGQLVSGTAWNANYTNNAPFTAEPYDTNGNPAFSTTELGVIKSVWQRVSEDYAPFGVDVTTQEPDPAAITRAGSADQQYGTRALITSTSTIYSQCGCGGIAYIGTYDHTANHSYYQPALVFAKGVGGMKNIAEATSHEVGHNLGLNHDGTATVGYYTGHGDWAPIMGVGYYEPITQWSRGQYAGANNTEDDFEVMAANGAPVRADDHGGTAATATTLSGPTFSAVGRIATAADTDAFRLTVGDGPASFSVQPAPTSANLDASVTVLDPGGGVVASANPASFAVSGDGAGGLGATVSTTLAAGTYTVVVDGVGKGAPATDGYSDYGSLGIFTLNGTVTTGGTPTNQAPVADATPPSASGTAPLPVNFSGAGSSDPDGSIASWAWTFGDGATASGATVAHTFATAGTYTVTLTVTDDVGATATDTSTVTVNPPAASPPAPPSNVSASAAGRIISVGWTDNADNETSFEVVRETYNAKKATWGTATVVANLGANVTTFSQSARGTYRYKVRALNGVGASPQATSNSVTAS